MQYRPNILLIYTGGTIGMVRDTNTGALKAFDFSELLLHIPELKQLDCNIQSVSFEKPIDSSNMDPEKWVQMASMVEEHYNDYDGFIILHGSDTMSYSASALSFMLENLQKPVILTGSQLPIGDLRTDAKENLITAIQVASLWKAGKPVVQEVCLYFEYKLYRGNRSIKINAEHFNAFTSPNYPALAESGVHLRVSNELLMPQHSGSFKVHKAIDSNVVILKIFPGINDKTLSAMVGIEGLKGLVLETYGSGNAPSEDWFISILKKAIAGGLHVVNVTQCSGGSVNMGSYETSTQLKEIGVISGADITTEAAITKMMFLLGKNTPHGEFKALFEKSLRGELSQ